MPWSASGPALSAYVMARAKAEAVKADVVVCPNLALTISFGDLGRLCASMVVAASIRVTSRFVTAAEVRPARAPHVGRMTRSGRSPGSRVVTLLRLPRPCMARPSGTVGEGLTADSCGGSSGLALPWKSHRIPSWPINAISTPERIDWKRKCRSLSTKEPSLFHSRLYFLRTCCFPSNIWLLTLSNSRCVGLVGARSCYAVMIRIIRYFARCVCLSGT